MKIGLYGGSFNPVHNGHKDVVNNVLEKGVVDEVWIMPCKEHAFNKDLTSINDRLNMLECVFNDVKNVRIDLTEVHSENKSYTSETIKALKEKYAHTFYFIVGSDALNDINKWHDTKYLKDNVKFIVVNRDGYKIKKNNLVLEAMIDSIGGISSTVIRERVRFGESIKGMVDRNVEEYIHKNNLYSDKIDHDNPASTVDLIVQYDKGIMLIKRKHPPFKNYWALPGGYLENGRETLEEAAVRELSEETSIQTNTENLELIGVYSNPERDPRGHVISHVYKVQKFSGTPSADDDASDIRIFKTLPKELAFDHTRILEDYYRKKIIKENNE